MKSQRVATTWFSVLFSLFLLCQPGTAALMQITVTGNLIIPTNPPATVDLYNTTFDTGDKLTYTFIYDSSATPVSATATFARFEPILEFSIQSGSVSLSSANGDMILNPNAALELTNQPGNDSIRFSNVYTDLITDPGGDTFYHSEITLGDSTGNLLSSLDLANITSIEIGDLDSGSLLLEGETNVTTYLEYDIESVVLSVVPEPTSAALLLGASGLLALRRRKAN